MSWADGLRHRLRALIDPEAHERELREEMEFHESLDAGQQGDGSRARRRFGNRTYYQEETRQMTWLRFVDGVSQDARYAWRSMSRTPGFTATVIVTLALGIGINAAMFTFLDRVFVRPPAGVDAPDGVRRMWIERYRGGVPYVTAQGISWPHYSAVRTALSDVADVAYYNTSDALSLGREYSGPPVHGVWATSNYFQLLGVRPHLGRLYTADEDSVGHASEVAVLGHAFWTRRLGADPAVVGRAIAIGPRTFTVIGVLEPDFTGLDVQSADIWFPAAAFNGKSWDGKPFWQGTSTWGARAIFRLATSASESEVAARATNALRAVDRERQPTRPDTLQKAFLGSIIEARGHGTRDRQLVVASRLGGVALVVLLVACANVVNLLLARAAYRRREIAVRLALGVSRSRLFRMVTTETLLLAAVGGVAAVLAAWWGGVLLRRLLLPTIEWSEPVVDARVIAFTAAMALLAGIIAAIIPAFQSTNPALTQALKAGGQDSGARGSRLRNGLVIAQTALSLTLLFAGALFLRSHENVRGIDLGFDPDQVLYSSLSFEEDEEPATADRAQRILTVAREMQTRPGVEAIAVASAAPMRGNSFRRFYTTRDSLGTLGDRGPSMQHVSAGFFEASGLRMLRGRTFSESDFDAGPAEVVVDALGAGTLWPDGDAIGQCVRFDSSTARCHRVVGVTETTRGFGILDNQAATIYIPAGSPLSPRSHASDVVIRAAAPLRAAVTAELDRLLRREFPLARSTSKAMSESLEPQFAPWKAAAALFTAFGGLALIVALVGIYSSVSYAVGQRTREFGVRIALGARLGDIVNQVLGEGVRVVVIGIAIGIALSLVTGRILSSMLFGVGATDPSALLLASSLMLLVAGLAALVPGWRAGRVDPVVALRAD